MEWWQFAVVGVMSFPALLVLVWGFKTFDLADGGQALGLPKGSVRAFLALALVLMFAGLSIRFAEIPAVFDPVAGAGDVQVSKVADSVFKLVAVRVDGKGEQETSVHLVDMDLVKGQLDLQKQMLTVLATVITSVVSFYFGARVAAGSESKGEAVPESASSGTPAAESSPQDTARLHYKEISGLLEAAQAVAAGIAEPARRIETLRRIRRIEGAYEMARSLIGEVEKAEAKLANATSKGDASGIRTSTKEIEATAALIALELDSARSVSKGMTGAGS